MELEKPLKLHCYMGTQCCILYYAIFIFLNDISAAIWKRMAAFYCPAENRQSLMHPFASTRVV